MKKILLIVSSTLLLANSFMAQDSKSDADKKVRFGLKITPTPTWLRSNQLNSVKKAGTKFGFGFGLQAEFRINSTASFLTGIGGDFLGGKQTFEKNQGYALDKENNFINFTDIKFGSDESSIENDMAKNGYTFYTLKSRTLKATYVTIPLLLKLMTKDISGIKYFGAFGINVAVQTKYRASDEVTSLKYDDITTSNPNGTKHYIDNTTSTINDLRPKGDLIPINVGLNAGIGAEYNLSGSTAVFLSINYLRGFINQYQNTSEHNVYDLKTTLNTNSKISSGAKQSAFVDGVQINIGILF